MYDEAFFKRFNYNIIIFLYEVSLAIMHALKMFSKS